jgi:mono/diheme cytochrome c family protein
MAMRPLRPGTVPREEQGRAPNATAVDAGVPTTDGPVPISAQMLAHGRRRYDTFCSPCHGADGRAQTPVARNMSLRPPPSLLDGRIRALGAVQIFQTATEGYGLMPGYARQLAPDDRWAVVAYVRALQLREGIRIDDLPPAIRADALRALGGRRE